MGIEAFFRFDENWKTTPHRRRGVKYLLTPSDESLAAINEFKDRFRRGVSTVIAALFEAVKLRGATLAGDCAITRQVVESHAGYLTDGLGFNLARVRRSVVSKATQIIKSYIKRNRKNPETPPRFRSTKSLSFADGPVRDRTPDGREGTLSLRLHNDIVVEVPYVIPKGMFEKKKALNFSSLGGNLVHFRGRRGKLDRWYYAALAKVPFQWQYEPETELGFDLNKEAEYFVTMSDQTVIAADRKIVVAVQRLTDLNARLKPARVNKKTGKKEYTPKQARNSKERRGVRKKVKAAHKRLKKLVTPLCRAILDKAVATKALVCIDTVKVGAKTGSYGHDHLIDVLTKMCEDEGVPFVWVPPHHTSMVHHACGNVGRMVDMQSVGERYYCQSCNVFFPAHFNAASVIAAWGRRIWDDGIFEFWKWKKPITEEAKRLKDEKARPAKAESVDVGTETEFVAPW